MSLTCYLYVEVDVGGDELFTAEATETDNTTHNLTKMADAAGLYDVVWRPEENGIQCAGDLMKPLEEGLQELVTYPDKYKQYNPDNGWGSYDNLVNWVGNYLQICKSYPKCLVYACR